MDLWKKGILVILSGFILFGSCQTQPAQQMNKKQTEGKTSTKELIQTFFDEVKIGDKERIQTINEIGQHIAKKDSFIQFFAFQNAYENNAFLFSANRKEQLNVLKKNSLLEEAVKTSTEQYTVWRPKIAGPQTLDISIEPHPTLHWVLVVRRRVQE